MLTLKAFAGIQNASMPFAAVAASLRSLRTILVMGQSCPAKAGLKSREGIGTAKGSGPNFPVFRRV